MVFRERLGAFRDYDPGSSVFSPETKVEAEEPATQDSTTAANNPYVVQIKKEFQALSLGQVSKNSNQFYAGPGFAPEKHNPVCPENVDEVLNRYGLYINDSVITIKFNTTDVEFHMDSGMIVRVRDGLELQTVLGVLHANAKCTFLAENVSPASLVEKVQVGWRHCLDTVLQVTLEGTWHPALLTALGKCFRNLVSVVIMNSVLRKKSIESFFNAAKSAGSNICDCSIDGRSANPTTLVDGLRPLFEFGAPKLSIIFVVVDYMCTMREFAEYEKRWMECLNTDGKIDVVATGIWSDEANYLVDQFGFKFVSNKRIFWDRTSESNKYFHAFRKEYTKNRAVEIWIAH
uniref:Uncharacterized protein n=1 Tax=Panagrolaimus sp. JU765 TaxID=591449 RepID=A0AC34RGW3_9BILA